MLSSRARAWLRELDKLPQAESEGADLLRICDLKDSTVEELEAELTRLDYKHEHSDGKLCVRLPGKTGSLRLHHKIKEGIRTGRIKLPESREV